jgi:hypothetical protein
MTSRRKLPKTETPEPEVQEGGNRSKVRDDALKRIIRQHPQRDEPRVDDVEADRGEEPS